LFGIVQGGMFEDLREASLETLTSLGFDGYAIGACPSASPKKRCFVCSTTSRHGCRRRIRAT